MARVQMRRSRASPHGQAPTRAAGAAATSSSRARSDGGFEPRVHRGAVRLLRIAGTWRRPRRCSLALVSPCTVDRLATPTKSARSDVLDLTARIR